MSEMRVCPDCGELLYFNSHFRVYMHPESSECVYMESVEGNRVWDNKMRDDRLQAIGKNAKIRLRTGEIMNTNYEDDALSL